jgi:hypothetical protein
MTIKAIPIGAIAVALLVSGSTAKGQSLAQRIAQAPDGKVRMSFAARPGVCGNGEGYINRRGERTEDWEPDCDNGPVRVLLEVRGHDVVRIRTFVGGRWRESRRVVTELGTVGAREAADYLVRLAESSEGSVSRKAILPATLADSAEVWSSLLRIARDETRPRRTRREALQWAGMEAGRVVTGGVWLGPEDEDDEVQAAAVFAISQLKKDEAVPALIRIARTHSSPRVRKRALFWLGQSGDPRAIDVLEEILRRR